MDYEKIGKFIQEQRKKLGMTQQELADKLKVTNKAISRWETGLGCPDVSLLGELSEILNVGIGELLNGEYNEQLKDNDKFILEAVNYSKQATTKNIYRKLSNLIYIIIGCICFYLIAIMINQVEYFISAKEEHYIDAEVTEIYNKVERIQEKTIQLSNLKIYSEEDQKYIRNIVKGLLTKVDELNRYKKENKFSIHEETLLKMASDTFIFYHGNNALLRLAAEYDPNNKLIYIAGFAYPNISMVSNIVGVEDDSGRSDLYFVHGSMTLDNYIQLLYNSLNKCENVLDVLLKIGGYYE